ncbi:MAG: TlpA family protein disulfide reductase [Mesorhizobium sp.]|nr:TlpA disulfide reductase family protein [Mesorhizobium sp. M2A.F.Ca.ET.043.02.1.1]AZO03856.1 TlpA family protein disulfide reductase [Mesorhizobium sp. M2A.F.Ca.ET.043.02.1.1]RWB53408.1 MAG: TlpA family protein disulfide reductase [Mesorhizobium sp.]TIU30544.1 MAG: TlpA family protein disulfide reductase [Mesorhizobium sp.]TJW85766.1 MAG: TlpA family protein disulfide reductase [Mesorhizobium sp.]
MVLQMGSSAPSINVETWVRGEPIAHFQPGKVYVVEFWATGSEPCAAAMHHLMQLQERFKDSGLEVIVVAAHEGALSTVEARVKLDAWLTEKCSNLNFPIAFDHTGQMKKRWVEASFSGEFPTLFVIDVDGRIAYIGHATRLNEVLARVLNGSWRTSDAAKVADSKRIADRELNKREQALTKSINRRFWAAVRKEDWETALSAVEEGSALMPDDINFRLAQAHLLLHRMQDMPTGLPVIRQLARDAIERNSEHWLLATLDQLFGPAHDHSHFPSHERFALGKELAEHILARNPLQGDGHKFRTYPAVARYYHESGNQDRAIELIEFALKSLDSAEPMLDELKQHLLPDLLQALANYKGEEVCYGALCAAPQSNVLKARSQGGPRRKHKRV